MKCSKCPAFVTYLAKEKTIAHCGIGLAECDDSNADPDNWGCSYNKKTVGKTMRQCGMTIKIQ